MRVSYYGAVNGLLEHCRGDHQLLQMIYQAVQSNRHALDIYTEYVENLKAQEEKRKAIKEAKMNEQKSSSNSYHRRRSHDDDMDDGKRQTRDRSQSDAKLFKKSDNCIIS